MSDLVNKYKEIIFQQQVDHKFSQVTLSINQLLQTNRQIQPIKIDSVPQWISPASNLLPSIYKEKSILRMKSKSQNRIKIPAKCKQDQEKEKMIQESSYLIKKIANVPIKSKSQTSIKKCESFNRGKKGQNKTERKKLLSLSRKERTNSETAIKQVHQQGAHQKQTIELFVTPNKIKIDFPIRSTQDSKIVINTTVKQISKQAQQSVMLNIKFGKIQQNISYKSFIRKDNPIKQEIIKRLGNWINKNKIKSGLIMTNRLQDIFSRKMIPNHMILKEFTNFQQLKKQHLNSMPGLKFYNQLEGDINGINLAAEKITSLFRMNFERRYSQKLRSLLNKVKFIQQKWKMFLIQKRHREQVLININKRIQKLKVLTQGMVKNWDLIKTSPKVELHICSISIEQFKRLSISDLQQREMAQLTRIFKANQPDCTIIYVSPISFPPNVLRYYERVFAFDGLGEFFHNKIHFINVQKSIQQISSKLTTVSALLYDSSSLKQIKQIIKQKQRPVMGQVCAYIVPSYPSNQYTSLAAQLQIPIFSNSQSLCKLYSSKSGSYDLLKQVSENLGEKCPFKIPKSVQAIYSEKQLINTLTVLIHKNKEVKKWVLKIDDQINSRGLAIFNVNNLAFLKQLGKTNLTLTQNISENDLMNIIAQQIKQKLKSKLKIVCKTAYKDAEMYLSHFLTRGGVIQAGIQPISYSSSGKKPVDHSISFKIQPNGQFEILNTYSRLQLGFKTIGQTIQCPSALTVQQVDNQKIVRALYRSLWSKKKLFGYFTLDCIYVQNIEKKDNFGHLFVIGLDYFLNEKTSSLFVPFLVSKSHYIKDLNLIQLDEKNFGSAKTKQQTELSQPSDLRVQENIHYIYCPFLNIGNLPETVSFFKECRLNNISFDIESKVGSLLLLQGGLENGSLGFMCMGKSRQKMAKETMKLLQFFTSRFQLKDSSKKKSFQPLTSNNEIGQLKSCITSLMKNYEKLQNKRGDFTLQGIF